MHELALTEAIIDIVKQQAEARQVSQVSQVVIVVGRLSGALPESLQFCFDAVSRGTVAEKATLIIDQPELPGCCNDCGAQFSVEERFAPCPQCHSFDVVVEGGDELYVKEIEIDTVMPDKPVQLSD